MIRYIETQKFEWKKQENKKEEKMKFVARIKWKLLLKHCSAKPKFLLRFIKVYKLNCKKLELYINEGFKLAKHDSQIQSAIGQF